MKELMYVVILLGFFIFAFFFSILHESIYISIFFLILTFLVSSLLFLISGVEFVGFLYLIVYVGAVAVLFLFMVMLFDRTEYIIFSRTFSATNNNRIWLVSLVIFLSYFLTKLFSFGFDFWIFENFYFFGMDRSFRFEFFPLCFGSNIEMLGSLLYGYFAWSFIGASLVLLLGMVGSIFLTQNGVLETYFSYKHQELKSQLLHRNI